MASGELLDELKEALVTYLGTNEVLLEVLEEGVHPLFGRYTRFRVIVGSEVSGDYRVYHDVSSTPNDGRVVKE